MRPGKVVGGESVAKLLRFSMGTFIEATPPVAPLHPKEAFPFLLVRAFIEAVRVIAQEQM